MDKFYRWLAFRLPQRLVYFCTIRLWISATAGKNGKTIVDSVRVSTAIKRWEKDNA